MYYVSWNKKILVSNRPRLKFHVLNHSQQISDNDPRYHFLRSIRRILGTQPVAWTPMNFSSRSKSVMHPKRSIKSVDTFGLGCTESVTPWRLHMHLHPAINNARWRRTRGRMTNQVWVEGIHRSKLPERRRENSQGQLTWPPHCDGRINNDPKILLFSLPSETNCPFIDDSINSSFTQYVWERSKACKFAEDEEQHAGRFSRHRKRSYGTRRVKQKRAFGMSGRLSKRTRKRQ